MLTFDHLRLVQRDPRELARYRRYLLGLQVGQLAHAAVAHENDCSCCQRESWSVTAATIALAVQAPTPTIMFNLNDEPAVNCEAN
jgi:hypothetical protein